MAKYKIFLIKPYAYVLRGTGRVANEKNYGKALWRMNQLRDKTLFIDAFHELEHE